jgi:uncharacterized protein
MTDAPRIEFPCNYPLWIIGDSHPTFQEDVLTLVRAHVADVLESSVNVRHSRDGSYASVRVTIVALGEDQLKTLHTALKSLAAVRMVL